MESTTGVCRKRTVNSNCIENLDCFSDICQNSKCIQGIFRAGQKVSHQNQCRSNSINSENICNKGDQTSSCIDDSDCLSKNCRNSSCTIGNSKPGEQVEHASQCMSTFVDSKKICTFSDMDYSCIDNSDCESKNCENKFCKQGNSKPGDQVASITQCISNRFNSNKICQKGFLESKCNLNSDCVSNNCENFKCVLGKSRPGEKVDDETQCLSRSVDSNKICSKLFLNNNCSANSECFSNNCKNSKCIEGTFLPGQKVDHANQCLTALADSKNICARGETKCLQNNNCLLSSKCVQNNDCISRNCRDGRCVLGNGVLSDVVEHETQCGSNKAIQGTKIVCWSSEIDGWCTRNEDCFSKNCQNGICLQGIKKLGEKTQNGSRSNQECRSNVIDTNRNCWKAEIDKKCVENIDCLSDNCINLVCKQGISNGGDKVLHRSQCRSNNATTENICLGVGFNSNCTKNSDCLSKNCHNFKCGVGLSSPGEKVDSQEQCKSFVVDSKMICTKGINNTFCNKNLDCFSNNCQKSACTVGISKPGDIVDFLTQCRTQNIQTVGSNKICAKVKLRDFINSCIENSDCFSNNCSNSKCIQGIAKPGDTVNHDNECRTGYQSNNICITSSLSNPCSENSDCRSKNCENSICIRGIVKAGQTIDSLDECRTGREKSKKCRKGILDSPCLESDDCLTMNCRNNKCVYMDEED